MSFDLTQFMTPGATPDAIAALPAQQQNILNTNAQGGATAFAGQVIAGANHLMFGIQAQQAAEFQAQQLRQNANSAMASASRQAWTTQQQVGYVQSRALAVAGASGAGASDPGVVSVMAHTAAIGAYQAASQLYTGADRARNLNLEAAAKDYQGKESFENSALVSAAQDFSGATNLLQSRARGASLYQRFAGGGPMTADATPNSGGY
jgi:hypothetical protein